MKSKPSGRFEGKWVGRAIQSRFGVVASNWLLQGMRYMNRYEIGLKVSIDLLLFSAFIAAFGSIEAHAILIAAILAHSLNWTCNGHFFALMRYVRPISKSTTQFKDFVEQLQRRALECPHITGVAVYGSYCRGQLHKHSDLDVRVTVGTCWVDGVIGALFCAKLRLLAFISTFPLDIYCCVGTKGLEKLRSDEVPVVLLDRTHALANLYRTNNK